MKKLLVAGLIFSIVSCGAGGNTNTSSDNADTTVKGNSAGSNTVEMDTMHMDTSNHKTMDSAH